MQEAEYALETHKEVDEAEHEDVRMDVDMQHV